MSLHVENTTTRAIQTLSFKRFVKEWVGKMTEVVKSVKVKGYNKTHTFQIQKIAIGGMTFMHLVKNNSVVLNCTEKEFEKMRGLFNE
tara:strand:- start:950 stop:1210 length:261 start_codon:yes stop_codon:yes gene_type:complete